MQTIVKITFQHDLISSRHRQHSRVRQQPVLSHYTRNARANCFFMLGGKPGAYFCITERRPTYQFGDLFIEHQRFPECCLLSFELSEPIILARKIFSDNMCPHFAGFFSEFGAQNTINQNVDGRINDQ